MTDSPVASPVHAFWADFGNYALRRDITTPEALAGWASTLDDGQRRDFTAFLIRQLEKREHL